MHRICLINLEWNFMNGFIFEILNLELDKPNIDSSLFGINVSKDFLFIDILFIGIKIYG